MLSFTISGLLKIKCVLLVTRFSFVADVKVLEKSFGKRQRIPLRQEKLGPALCYGML